MRGSGRAERLSRQGAIEKEARTQLESAQSGLPADVNAEAKVISDEAVPALAQEASAPGSILVLGSRGYGALRGVMLGSAAASAEAAATA